MANKQSRKRLLLDGRALELGGLDARQRSFLADLEKMKRQGVSYFEVYRAALGPGSLALSGRSRVDKKLAESVLYLTAQDIATRAGIEQGLILAPEHDGARGGAPADASMISVTQAAALIGVTRAAVYKAIEKKAIRALHIGNVTVVERASALDYKTARREVPTEPRAGREKSRRRPRLSSGPRRPS
jgi:excisionase family DNA binding protein